MTDRILSIPSSGPRDRLSVFHIWRMFTIPQPNLDGNIGPSEGQQHVEPNVPVPPTNENARKQEQFIIPFPTPYCDTGDEEFEKVRAELRAASTTASRALKKAEKEIDRMDIGLDREDDQNKTDEYGYQILPLPHVDENPAYEGVYQDMYSRIRGRDLAGLGDLYGTHEEAVLKDKADTEIKEKEWRTKKEQRKKMGKPDGDEVFDELEKQIVGKPSIWKR